MFQEDANSTALQPLPAPIIALMMPTVMDGPLADLLLGASVLFAFLSLLGAGVHVIYWAI